MPSTLMIISTLSAKLAELALFILLAKFITKRIGAKKLDAKLMKIHKPATYVVVIAGVIHMCTSFSSFETLGIMPYLLGFVCLLSIIGAVLSFVKRKDIGKRWVVWHRACSLLALVTLFLHPIL